jgi:hypothetical protein
MSGVVAFVWYDGTAGLRGWRQATITLDSEYMMKHDDETYVWNVMTVFRRVIKVSTSCVLKCLTSLEQVKPWDR